MTSDSQFQAFVFFQWLSLAWIFSVVASWLVSLFHHHPLMAILNTVASQSDPLKTLCHVTSLLKILLWLPILLWGKTKCPLLPSNHYIIWLLLPHLWLLALIPCPCSSFRAPWCFWNLLGMLLSQCIGCSLCLERFYFSYPHGLFFLSSPLGLSPPLSPCSRVLP